MAFRLRRQLLSTYGERSASEVAGAVFGLHAQVHSCAGLMWSARSSTASRADLDLGLWEERSLVKAWFMRGTLHVLPARDYLLYGAARGQDSLPDRYLEYYGMARSEFEAVMDAVPAALSDVPTSRRELVAALGHRFSPVVAERLASGWGMLLKPLVWRGLICFGRPRGQETTFVLASAWLGEVPAWDRDEAVAELARRYLRVFGPATRPEFARWAGFQPARGRVAWERLAPELVEVSVGGSRRWLLRSDLDELAGAEPASVVRLLGGFDTYLIAHIERSHLGVPAALRPRVWREAGWISAAVLVDGRVAGVWSHTVARGVATVTVERFGPVSRSVRSGVEAEVERLARYLGASPRLAWAR